jgi:hypothetical protein
VLQFFHASSLRTVVVLCRRPAYSPALDLPHTIALLPVVANSPISPSQLTLDAKPPGPCLLRAAAAVAAITTWIPLLSSLGSAYVDILVTTQIADVPILTSTISLPVPWTTPWYRRSTSCSTIIVTKICPTRTCVVFLFLPLHCPGSSLRAFITTSATPWHTIASGLSTRVEKLDQAGTTTESGPESTAHSYLHAPIYFNRRAASFSVFMSASILLIHH